MATLCIYCGSNVGNDPLFLETARLVGKILAEGDHTLVYGGGSVGLMGVVADAALAAGGKVIGIIPELFVQEKREIAHSGLTELHVVDSMHERKYKMASLADAFLALPGGIGTLEEIIEAFTWTQIGIHPKPCALLNVNGFYNPLMTLLADMVEKGFLHREQLSQLIVEAEPEVAINHLLSHKPRLVNKWMESRWQ
ncbi:MAG: TIGR00730 family Rossman fold protein [Chthoniobacterales bacterium]|nr:TIGR00730 family Rossman fold protein [Chthoniobacterales bacterium]